MQLKEELANTLSHGIGLICSLAALPVLILGALDRGDAANVVGAAAFGVTMILLYLASTWYHALPEGPIKSRFQVLDHAAIYLLIAGSYTPFTLGVLRGAWGWTLFGLVWSAAAVGVIVKWKGGIRFARLSTAAYLVMGWLVVIALKPLLALMPVNGLLLLAAGGMSYTVGVFFYATNYFRFSHAVWHLFVLGGTTCHFFAALWYAV